MNSLNIRFKPLEYCHQTGVYGDCGENKLSIGFYHAGGDHLLEPLALGLVVEIDAAHQVISCRTVSK